MFSGLAYRFERARPVYQWVLLIFCAVAGHALAEESPPHILIITADNLGYGDLRSFNPHSRIPTPNLDRLAQQGARLTNFYTASPTCTVSRACLLTGRIPQRHGLQSQLSGVAGNYGVGLNPHEKLIPQYLQQSPVSYRTGCFGKWNIGFAPGSRPTDRGFDEFVGHASGNLDYFHHNYRERHDLFAGTAREGVRELHREGEYSTDIFADAACDFISLHSNSNKPWFCYLAFNAPHFPTVANKRPGQVNEWQAPDWAFEACGLTPAEKDPVERYRAVVHALDIAIGRVLKRLQELEIAERTLVFFMSDNGSFMLDREGLDVGSNLPLRSGGVTCWEGGLRVPALACWPGKIPAGATIDQPLWSPDLLPACLRLSGAPWPANTILDGRDPLPVIMSGAQSPHQSFFFQYASQAALRSGDWKIVRESPQAAWQLFQLSSDISESHDLAEQHPQRVQELATMWLAWTESF